MLKNTVISSAIVLMAGMFATSAMADGGEKSAMQGDKQAKQNVSFQKIDENSDGHISESEFQSANITEVDHKMLDSDNDGRVTETEFAVWEQLPDQEVGQNRGRARSGH